jgi:hypothetical protein
LQDRQHTVAMRVAGADGVLVALAGAAVVLATAAHPLSGRPASEFVLMTVGLGFVGGIVAWRAYRYNVALLGGQSRWWRPIAEGFFFGWAIPFFWLLFLAAEEALAAGRPYDGAAEWGVAQWLQYAGSIAAISLYPAAVGALVGAAVSVVNRLLLRIAV